MPKIVRVTMLAYLVLCIVFLFTFVGSYGGLHGNLPADYRAEPQSHPISVFRVVCNNWYLDPETEPLLVTAFMFANTPSVLLAWGVHAMLVKFLPAFQTPYPLGLSAGTYTYGLTLLLSPFQWLFVGYLIRAVLRRRKIAPQWTG